MINRSIIPYFDIPLSLLLHASDINSIMKVKQVKLYTYEFNSTFGVLKYGSSKDNEWKRHGVYGDRIYRQANHIPGWPQCAGPLTSGNDMLNILAHYPTLTKKDVIIRVWDMTNYPFLAKADPKEVEEFECELIDDYKRIHGHAPIGNPKDMTFAGKKTVVPDAVFDHMFV